LPAAPLWCGGQVRRLPRQSLAGIPAEPERMLPMTMSTIALTPLISLIAGVLILVMPRLLNYIVAIYLIIAGLLGLFPHLAG